MEEFTSEYAFGDALCIENPSLWVEGEGTTEDALENWINGLPKEATKAFGSGGHRNLDSLNG